MEYNQLRLKGDKKTANKILIEFINGLKNENQKTIESFVYSICKLVLDKAGQLSNNGTDVSNSNNRIQHPLFKEILIPVFIRKYKENEATYIRWIGQLEQFFYSDNNTTQLFLESIKDELSESVQLDSKSNQDKTISCRNFSTQSFFIKSYHIEPDQKTLDLLLDRLAQDIFYAMHELPTGILVEPDIFINDIKEFEFYFEKSNKKAKWESYLHKWKSMGQHWKEYSENKSNYKGFKHYLDLNGITNYA